MLQKVQKYMNELNMVSPKDVLLVGVSGGADSVALLLVLYALYKDTDVTLEVVHVEHGIRGEESIQDADFVEDLCRRLEIDCHRVSVNVPQYAKENGLGLEEAARFLRYEAFSNLAKEKGAKVVLAHHKEDNAETILFQMARGSALNGLCGIKPIRMDENEVVYIRPFLTLHRSEIEGFLTSHGQEFCVDSTNKELEYSRNYVRHNILPALTKMNSQAIEHINDTAEVLSEVKDYLEQEAESRWKTCVKKTADGLCFHMKEISLLHPVLQKEIIYRGIAEAAGSRKDISAIHVKLLQELHQNQSGKEVALPYQLIAKKEYDDIWIVSQHEDRNQAQENEVYVVSKAQLETCVQQGGDVSIALGDAGEQLVVRMVSNIEKNMQYPTNSYTKWLDYDKIKDGFCIRTRQSGDYFISDVLGHHKNLNRYFIDEKIPAKERDSLWLLAQNHTVLWLIGGRISEHIKITHHTKVIVELKYQGGKKNEC